MEIELKLLLRDDGEAEALRERLGRCLRRERQHNLYFDDREGSWRAAGLAARLRRFDDRVQLTVKTAGDETASAHSFVQRGEWEQDFSPARWEELARGGGALRAAIVPLLAPPSGPGLSDALLEAELRPVGAMDNLRRVFAVPGPIEGLHAELDETSYPNGQVLHELELELPAGVDAAAAAAQLRVCFDEAGVPWRPSTESKRARLQRVLEGERLDAPGDPSGT